VPSPNVAEDHQTRNAMSLVKSNAALIVPDAEAQLKLVSTSIDLVNDRNKMVELSDNILKLAYPEASKSIANIIINSVNIKIS
jgi:UDP-N-acetylglucosamine--N-acetylmuramyl-(pentapeptide) pyrophosphoryl-undecaprenol N-acetylglucosamine transferase